MAKVFLSAGHGGTDPGAVAYGLKEKDINLNILKSCRDVLETHGVDVVCSREKDENDPVAQEVKEANKSKADLAVSFHTNAGGGDGSEAYYYKTNKNAKKLAELGEKYIKQLGQNSRGIKTGNHLYFIKHTDMTAVLFECFFVDNDKDNNIGDTAAEQKKLGIAYAKAILEYLGIKYKSDNANKATTASTTKTTSKTEKVDAAKEYSKKYSKRYTTKDKLNLRYGASMEKAIILTMPKGAKVDCYGYYTKNEDDTVWMLVSYKANNKTYTGFCSKNYLK